MTDEARIADGLGGMTQWSSALSWADIPDVIRRRAAVVLAAIIAARDEPEVIALHDGMARSSGTAEATVFNARGQKLDRHSAATANGSAADWCELDEGYRRALCHAGLYCVPALLAEAAATGAQGAELLRALVIGYETSARVARAFEFATLNAISVLNDCA
jgi:2-methylcitrate dehydratase PrpD